MIVPETGDVLSSSNISLRTALLFFSGCAGFGDFFGRSSTDFISTTSGELLPLLDEFSASGGRHVRSSSKNCFVNLSFFASGLSLSFEASSSAFLFSVCSEVSSLVSLSSKCLKILGDFSLAVSLVFLFREGGGVQGGVMGVVDLRDRSRGTRGSL